MMKYDTLLFDADGTLLDFKLSEREAIIDTLRYYDIDPTDEIIESYSQINDNLWKMLERGEVKKSQLRIQRFATLAEVHGYTYNPAAVADTYAYRLSTKSHLLGNALEVCTELSKTCRLYLITNGFVSIQHGRLDRSPITPLFKDIFISENLGVEKPARQYFDIVSAQIPEFDASKALVIGDSLSSDIKGGINAGIDVCWFNPGGKRAPDEMKIDYVISDLSELCDITK